MIISFSPQRRDDVLTVSKAGDVLTINGATFDFSALPEGGSIDAEDVPSEWIVGTVERVNGGLRLTFVLPHGRDPSEAVAHPASLVDPADGLLSIPADPPLSIPIIEIPAAEMGEQANVAS